MSRTFVKETESVRVNEKMAQPAVFLDRDGTINVEKNYLYRIEDWEWIPGAVAAIRAINRAGYLVVVVSNQAGVARGLYSEEDVRLLHAFVDAELASEGALINAYYVCPHHPGFGDQLNCDCRKPFPGMILQAGDELNIDLAASWLVGDKLSDIEAAEAAGVTPILVRTGYGKKDSLRLPANVRIEEDLAAACQHILSARPKLFKNAEVRGTPI